MAEPSAPKKRPGGRNARVVGSILDAAEYLLEHQDGFPSVEDIARRAGVQKTTIYRRWGTLEQLLLDTLRRRIGQDIPLPDTGTLHGDLRAYVAESIHFHQSRNGQLLVQLTPQSPLKVRQAYWQGRYAQLEELFLKALKRGELRAMPDSALVIEMLIAPLYMRQLISGDSIEEHLGERLLRVMTPYLQTFLNE